jgi:hypothetical protein
MTKQQIMDKVALHLITQGKPARASYGTGDYGCVYRGDDGAMCAVGCLIEDAAYTTGLEMNTVHSSQEVKYALVVSGVLDDTTDANTIDFLDELQQAHDQNSEDYPDEWLRSCMVHLLGMCVNHKLTVPDCITDYYR